MSTLLTSRPARIVAAVSAFALVIGVSTVAFAHTEFDVAEVAPGSIVTLNLFVENESSTAGTNRIELRFPERLVIVDVPASGEWTAEAVEGEIGSEAIGVVWSRATAGPGDFPTCH